MLTNNYWCLNYKIVQTNGGIMVCIIVSDTIYKLLHNDILPEVKAKTNGMRCY